MMILRRGGVKQDVPVSAGNTGFIPIPWLFQHIRRPDTAWLLQSGGVQPASQRPSPRGRKRLPVPFLRLNSGPFLLRPPGLVQRDPDSNF